MAIFNDMYHLFTITGTYRKASKRNDLRAALQAAGWQNLGPPKGSLQSLLAASTGSLSPLYQPLRYEIQAPQRHRPRSAQFNLFSVNATHGRPNDFYCEADAAPEHPLSFLRIKRLLTSRLPKNFCSNSNSSTFLEQQILHNDILLGILGTMYIICARQTSDSIDVSRKV